MAVKWYYKMAGQEIGPFTSQQLKKLAEEKRIAPDDPVRRDIDTDWVIAKDVKGLFPPEATAIPMGSAVPAAPVKAVPVAQVVPVGAQPKSAPVRAVPPVTAASPTQTSENGGASDPVSGLSFDFEASSSQKASARGVASRHAASARSAKRGVSKASVSAEEEDTEEKPPLTKKEIQKRNFIICAIAMGAVILLAALIMIIVSCSGGDKPATSQGESAAVPLEEGEVSESEGENVSGEDGADDSADADQANGEEEHPFIPGEWLEAGYRCPLDEKGGKPKSCTFGSMQIMVKRIEAVPLREWNPKTRAKEKDKKCCFIKVEVKNVNKDGKLMDVPGWGANGSSSVKLFDDKENLYKTLKYQVPGQADRNDQKGPDDSFTDVLVFNAPNLQKVEFLRLVLPSAIKGEDDALLFLPKEFLLKKNEEEGKKTDAPDDETQDAESAEGTEKNSDAAENGETAETSSDEKDVEKPEPNALADSALTDGDRSGESRDSDAPAPPAVGSEAKELDDAAKQEEELDIFNDPSLNQ